MGAHHRTVVQGPQAQWVPAACWCTLEQSARLAEVSQRASAAAIAQLALQVLPRPLARAQELMGEEVADARVAEAWMEMTGACSDQPVETSLC